jgi:hypothetical protein
VKKVADRSPRPTVSLAQYKVGCTWCRRAITLEVLKYWRSRLLLERALSGASSADYQKVKKQAMRVEPWTLLNFQLEPHTLAHLQMHSVLKS